MSAVGWLAVTAMLWLVPAHRGAAARSRPGGATTSRRRGAGAADRRRWLGVVLTAALVGVACVAALGWSAGLAAAVVGCPGVGMLATVLARLPARAPPDPALPLVLDLVAAGLRAGRPIATALACAAPAAGSALHAQLRQVSGLLSLGADAELAWRSVARAGPLQPVATVAVRSATSGIRAAETFERLARELRSERVDAATARAHRAGVRALGPLAACFLPSFVCLGVVPVVVGMLSTALQ